jgi:hypothetical protein
MVSIDNNFIDPCIYTCITDFEGQFIITVSKTMDAVNLEISEKKTC